MSDDLRVKLRLEGGLGSGITTQDRLVLRLCFRLEVGVRLWRASISTCAGCAAVAAASFLIRLP